MKNSKESSIANISTIFESENFGKLLIRITIGAYFIASGIKYFAGGWNMLESLGKIFSAIGISFFPRFFGISSSIVLILCGMSFMIGFFFKINSFLLFVLFLLKTVVNWKLCHNFWNNDFLFSFIISIFLFSLIFIGPGRFSADKR